MYLVAPKHPVFRFEMRLYVFYVFQVSFFAKLLLHFHDPVNAASICFKIPFFLRAHLLSRVKCGFCDATVEIK